MDSVSDQHPVWAGILFLVDSMPGPIVVQVLLLAATAIVAPAVLLSLVVNSIMWATGIRLGLAERKSGSRRIEKESR